MEHRQRAAPLSLRIEIDKKSRCLPSPATVSATPGSRGERRVAPCRADRRVIGVRDQSPPRRDRFSVQVEDEERSTSRRCAECGLVDRGATSARDYGHRRQMVSPLRLTMAAGGTVRAPAGGEPPVTVCPPRAWGLPGDIIAADPSARLLRTRTSSRPDQPQLVARVIADPDAAQRERFLGSPTIRVNGRDVDPSADRRRDYGLCCTCTRPRWAMRHLARVVALLRPDPADHLDR